MRIKKLNNNPFTSKIFGTIWIEHFGSGQTISTIEPIGGINFIKHSYLPLFYNIGKTNTKGINYDIINGKANSLRKKVILIYDVPEYFDVITNKLPENIAIHKTKQYPGFLIDLNKYNTLDQFMGTFSKRTRYKFNKCKRRLNLSFSIEHKVYFGQIEDEQYEYIFSNFRRLLEKRFDDKGVTNNNLEAKEWSFYKEVTLPMIRDKQAALSVIYENGNPIAITLNFIGDGVLFDAITVFDICYHKFNLGYVHLMYLIDWCLKSDLKIFDFSKGYLEYKENWANLRYPFNYHIIHDTEHIPSSIIAFGLRQYFRFKQKLRELNVNKVLHKLTFFIKKGKDKSLVSDDYTLDTIEEVHKLDSMTRLEPHSEVFENLRSEIISFLFLNDGHINDVEIYHEPQIEVFYIKLKDTVAKLTKQ